MKTAEREQLEGRELELQALARIATVVREEADRLREHSAARALCDLLGDEVLPAPRDLVAELEDVQRRLGVHSQA